MLLTAVLEKQHVTECCAREKAVPTGEEEETACY